MHIPNKRGAMSYVSSKTCFVSSELVDNVLRDHCYLSSLIFILYDKNFQELS